MFIGIILDVCWYYLIGMKLLSAILSSSMNNETEFVIVGLPVNFTSRDWDKRSVLRCLVWQENQLISSKANVCSSVNEVLYVDDMPKLYTAVSKLFNRFMYVLDT